MASKYESKNQQLMLIIMALMTISVYANNKKVLIIGIDGCRPDSMLAAKTPNLDKLWKNGAFSFFAQADTKTRSGPCWTSMLTGFWHKEHGITSNHYREKLQHPHFFKYIKEQSPSSKTISIINWEPIHKILPDNLVNIKIACKSDQEVKQKVVSAISEEDIDVIFLQLDDVDHAGHAAGYGPTRPKYIKAIESTDKIVGELVSAVHNRPTYKEEDWLIIVSTDHGGVHRNHGKQSPQEMTIFFIANGPSVQKGELTQAVNIIDVASTALAHKTQDFYNKHKLSGKVVGLKQPTGGQK
ncbi:MAG: alkaline phosphatase family protein [Lentisphaeria bacterium]|nr:alkaline phosphatase family protein [Lentisphaeria bacterium]